MSETATRVMATKVNSLMMVESGGTAMSYADAQSFLKNNTCFPVDTSTCAYCLVAHNVIWWMASLPSTSPL